MPDIPNPTQLILLGCSFTKEVLRMTWSWLFLAGLPPQSPHVDGVAAWLTENTARANGQERRKVADIVLYF
jgi:hypothetical protein